jgi:hypothetical protein
MHQAGHNALVPYYVNGCKSRTRLSVLLVRSWLSKRNYPPAVLPRRGQRGQAAAARAVCACCAAGSPVRF